MDKFWFSSVLNASWLMSLQEVAARANAPNVKIVLGFIIGLFERVKGAYCIRFFVIGQ